MCIRDRICTPTSVVTVDGVRVIGERINPTGKKRFRQALIENDMDYIVGQGMEQAEAGADILDVNVGLPEIDEPEMMVRTVKNLQSVLDLPLQLDSSDPEAIEAGLRVYNGKPIVNSVNGAVSYTHLARWKVSASTRWASTVLSALMKSFLSPRDWLIALLFHSSSKPTRVFPIRRREITT